MNKSGLLLAFGILLAGYFLQTFLIWPIESSFRRDDLVDMVSFVFVPHGLKVLVFMMFGVAVFPVVFLAQLINGILLTGNLDTTGIMGAMAGVICIALPVLLLNLSIGRRITDAPLFNSTSALNLFWTFILVACVASLINGILHSAIYGFPAVGLPFLYLIGDVLGALSICVLLLLSRGVIMALLRNFEVRNDKS